MPSFEVHSNESACRKSGCIGLEQVTCRCFAGVITHQSTTDARLNIISLPKKV